MEKQQQQEDDIVNISPFNWLQSVIFYTLTNKSTRNKCEHKGREVGEEDEEEDTEELAQKIDYYSPIKSCCRRNRCHFGCSKHHRDGSKRRFKTRQASCRCCLLYPPRGSLRFCTLLAFCVQAMLLIAIMIHSIHSIAPTIDYSHNMRILKLPKSIRVGELVYRLKGSDGDPSSQLRFGVSGINGRSLLDIVPVPNSWNEADVYLRTKLIGGGAGSDLDSNELSAPSQLGASFYQQQQQQQQHLPVFNLTVYVSDGNKSTQVESTIIVTDDDELDLQPALSSSSSPLLPLTNNRSSIVLDTTNDYKSFHHQHHQHHLQANDRPSIITNNNVNITSINGGGVGGSVGGISQQQQAVNSGGSNLLLSPFIKPRQVFNVPENTAPGEAIGELSVRESDKSDLPVRFELRGAGADHFSIKYVFGPRGQSRGQLTLAAPLDYERQNLFSLKVLALNAWTNVKYDTRNVATLDIVITVGDVQDTAPQFKQLPHLVRLTNIMQAGELVARVHAEDGDYGDQRPVQYALDASSPLIKYFTIDKQSGDITLTRPANELTLAGATDSTAAQPVLVVYASELPDTSSYDHLWPPMFARAELPLAMVDLINEPPRFVGGWQTQTNLALPSTTSSQPATTILHGFVRELTAKDDSHASGGPGDDSSSSSSSSGQLVQWYVNRTAPVQAQSSSSSSQEGASNPSSLQAHQWHYDKPMVLDLGQGANGTFELFLEGPDAHLFELEPNYAVSRQTIFNLLVAPSANRSLFDADIGAQVSSPIEDDDRHHHKQLSFGPRVFQVDVVARDFGTPQRLSSRVRCLIELADVNDNAPQFDQDLYMFSMYENSQLNQVLGSVRARDPDAKGQNAAHHRVRYSSLTGRNSQVFKLDPDSGLITLVGQLDREKQDQYLLLAEARDSSGGSASNYTKIMVNVLDVNDNAPVFGQSHYDAVLQADGTFAQPLVVSASDADEPNSANSQVSYEIIAGNQNDQFAIDSLSGTIYLVGSPQQPGGALPVPPLLGATRSPAPIQLPSILSEPIVPFNSNSNSNSNNNNNNWQQHQHPHQLDQHGKILPAPGHEIEETTVPSHTRNSNNNNNNNEYHNQHNRLVVSRSSGDTNGAISRLTPPLDQSGGSSGFRSSWPRMVGSASLPPPPVPQSPPDGTGSNLEESGNGIKVSPGDGAGAGLAAESPMNLLEQLPALDLLLNLDAHMDSPTSGSGSGSGSSSRHLVRSVVPPGQSPDSSTGQQRPQPTSSPPLVTSQREAAAGANQFYFDAFKVPPVTTLVVRAHDFGIPLRSSTCKVNIYNQALLSRSISVILNGTAEQLEQRRDMIERALGALTASKVQIESIDALSDSSSICVARLRLSIPAGHSLIDLTDLSSLMSALDYKPTTTVNDLNHRQQQQQPQQDDTNQPFIRQSPAPGTTTTITTHYIAAGDRIYPVQTSNHLVPLTANLTPTTSAGGSGGGGGLSGLPAFYTDINQFSLDSNMLERKLLFYIIIVGICILALLIIWMIYFCCREDAHTFQRDSVGGKQQVVESGSRAAADESSRKTKSRYKHKSSSKTQLINAGRTGAGGDNDDDDDDVNDSGVNHSGQADGHENQMAATTTGDQLNSSKTTHAKVAMTSASSGATSGGRLLATIGSPIGNNLAKLAPTAGGAGACSSATTSGNGAATGQYLSANPLMKLSSDHYSMYNGQVWFEQGGLRVRRHLGAGGGGGIGRLYADERRASSAPSAGNSFDSSLHAAILAGRTSAMSPATISPTGNQSNQKQFFPNTIGYMQNLNSIAAPSAASATGSGTIFGKRNRRRQVVPMTLLTTGSGGGSASNGRPFADNFDLESGASGADLVLVPASSLALANGLRHAHRVAAHSKLTSGGGGGGGDSSTHHRRHHRHHHHHHHLAATRRHRADRGEVGASLGNSSESTCSTSSSDATPPRTLAGAESHESVLLDSDQELLGFDSTGTPIIATHTRRRSGQSGDRATTTATATTRSLLSEMTESTAAGAAAPASNSATSPTPTHAAGSMQIGRPSGGGGGGALASNVSANKRDGATGTNRGQVVAAAAGQQLDLQSEQKSNSEKDADPEKQQQQLGQSSNQLKQDLMGELNERFSAAATKNTIQQARSLLKRQSADENEPERELGGDLKVKSGQQQSDDSNKEARSYGKSVADAAANEIADADVNEDDKLAASQRALRRGSGDSLSCQSSASTETTIANNSSAAGRRLVNMKNGELLEKQSIFALTYSGLATDKLPS